MTKILFTAQNEATDEDGFFLEGEAAIAAELATLVEMGAPMVGGFEIHSIEAVDRDEAQVEATATADFTDWLYENDIEWEFAE